MFACVITGKRDRRHTQHSPQSSVYLTTFAISSLSDRSNVFSYLVMSIVFLECYRSNIIQPTYSGKNPSHLLHCFSFISLVRRPSAILDVDQFIGYSRSVRATMAPTWMIFK